MEDDTLAPLSPTVQSGVWRPDGTAPPTTITGGAGAHTTR